MGLDLHAELGNETLAGFREKLSEGERGYALKDRRKDDDADDFGQQKELMFCHHVIDEVFSGSWQNQTTCTIYNHQ